MTPTEPTVCMQDACTQDCTTECRAAINGAWTALRGELPPATLLASIERVPPSESEHLRGGSRLRTPEPLGPIDHARTTEQLLNLADRTEKGLTPDEAARLRDGVAHHCARAEQAEAELTALKTITSGYCGHCGRGDCSPTADQWYEQRQRAAQAEAAIERVRATCARLHDLAHAAHGEPTSSYDRGIDRAAKVIRAALDERQEQPPATPKEN